MKNMHAVRLALLAACTGTALASCTASLSPPAVTSSVPAAPTEAEWIARGEYITRIAGCNDCHTPDWGERVGEVPIADWLVGAPLGFTGPWGTTYASNLRKKVAGMDEAAWMEYTRTLTTRPIMPYYNVRAMTEDDRLAMYHFIHSLGDAGSDAPAHLPPGQRPQGAYMELILPGPAVDGRAAPD